MNAKSGSNKKSALDTSNNNVCLAMVTLSEPWLPSIQQLEQRLKGQEIAQSRFSNFSVEGSTIGFDVGSGFGAIALVPVPLPKEELEQACAMSVAWPEALEVLADHKAHLICTVAGPVTKKAAAMFLTALVAAIGTESPATGVYWGGATLVHSPEMFVGEAESMSDEVLPLYLWIQFPLIQSAEKTSLRTEGMASLGFMEIEIVNSSKSPEDVISFAYNICHYLLDNGPVLKDGETIGMSETEKIRVSHRTSILNPHETVYNLAF